MNASAVLHESRAAEAVKPTLRASMESIARALRVELAPHAEAALSLVIDNVPATIAPTRQGRIAAFFKLAEADRVSRKVMVGALSEAAAWGVRGATLRFVVLDGDFALLWSPEPMTESDLLEQLDEAIATALAVAELVASFPA